MTWSRQQLLKIRQNIRLAAQSLQDETAAETPELFEPWEADHLYAKDVRFQYKTDLYKTRQAHTSQADWTPEITASLYERIPKPGEGDSPDKPIPYRGNMRIELGMYYEQYGVVYVGIADSIYAVHNDLKDLVGLYVEEVSEA